jgi:hypothetical protein
MTFIPFGVFIIFLTHHMFFLGELGAVMQYFDVANSGSIQSSDFLTHFIKVGMAERTKAKARALTKQRTMQSERQKEQADRLAAQWALADANITMEYAEEDRESALEKLTEIASKYDPANPGPMGLTAFQCATLSPAVFREMLRRSFHLSVTDYELASLVDMFKKEGSGNRDIVCAEFLLKFRQLGLEKKSELRLAQLEKSKQLLSQIGDEMEAKKRIHDDKAEENLVDFNFTKDDFNSALDKIRSIVSNYDPNHVAAPSLKGFVGANMRAAEFKDMIMRTFQVQLTRKELGSLVKFYDTSGNGTIDNREFLAHFGRLLRVDQQNRRKLRIEADRSVMRKLDDSQQEKDQLQRRSEIDRLKYGPRDEKSFLKKLREAAQEYAVNSVLFMEPLQVGNMPYEILHAAWYRGKDSFSCYTYDDCSYFLHSIASEKNVRKNFKKEWTIKLSRAAYLCHCSVSSSSSQLVANRSFQISDTLLCFFALYFNLN